jgi:hypothetical protein
MGEHANGDRACDYGHSDYGKDQLPGLHGCEATRRFRCLTFAKKPVAGQNRQALVGWVSIGTARALDR